MTAGVGFAIIACALDAGALYCSVVWWSSLLAPRAVAPQFGFAFDVVRRFFVWGVSCHRRTIVWRSCSAR
jgi:hypothetical protein